MELIGFGSRFLTVKGFLTGHIKSSEILFIARRESRIFGEKKTMRYVYCLLLPLILAFSSTLNAQTVEVLVEEIVELKPVEITYIIRLSNPYEDLLGTFGDLEEEGDRDIKLDEPNMEDLERMLEKKKYTFEKIDYKGSSLLDLGSEGPALKVMLKSVEEMKTLESLFTDYENVESFMSDARYEPLSNYHDTVYPSLLKAAEEKATIIATASKKSLGSIVSVEEIGGSSGEMNDLFSMYSNMFRSVRMADKLGIDRTKEEKKVQLRVKFELK